MAAVGEKLFCALEYHTSKSVATVQRAFRAKYTKDLPTDQDHAWYKQSTETGCLCKKKSSGCPLTTEDDIEQVRASFLFSFRTSLVVKKKNFSFSVAVNNSIKVGPLVFLL
jgi:hypothetical protein